MWGWLIILLVCTLLILVKFALPYIVFPAKWLEFGPFEPEPAIEQEFLRCGCNKIAFIRTGKEFAHKRPVVIYSHGNGEVLTKKMQEQFEQLAQDCSVMIILYDYPGYGKSEGMPSEDSVNHCIDSVIQSLGVDVRDLLIVGRSIGTGPSVQWASKHAVKGLFLISPFCSIITTKIPFTIPGLDMFPSLHCIKKVRCPVIVCHGKHDRLVPFAHGVRLAAAAQHGTLISKEAGHNDLDVMHELREFIKKNTQSQQS